MTPEELRGCMIEITNLARLVNDAVTGQSRLGMAREMRRIIEHVEREAWREAYEERRRR